MTEKKKNPRGSGKDHPFGAVHPFTAGQKKEVDRLLEEQRKNFFSAGPLTAETIGIIQNLVDVKVEEKARTVWAKRDIEISVFRDEYFNWKDTVWSAAVGIVIGIIISRI